MTILRAVLVWLSALGVLVGTTRVLWLRWHERHRRDGYVYRVRGKKRPQ